MRHLAVDDVKVFVREEVEHFVDVVLVIQHLQCPQQISPAHSTQDTVDLIASEMYTVSPVARTLSYMLGLAAYMHTYAGDRLVLRTQL